MAAFEGIKVAVPALYVAGDHDLVIAFPGAAEHIANMKQHVPHLRDIQMLPGCGHWTQQERPQKSAPRLSSFCEVYHPEDVAGEPLNRFPTVDGMAQD